MTPDYATAEDFLLTLKQRGVRPGLDRMLRLVAALGHPERSLPCIHIAGTNGKGSVAAMLEAIFRAAGWRTGLYTSPHLIRLGERIQLNRQPLTPNALAALVAEFRPVVEQLDAEPEGGPGFFEFMTALALVHFSRTPCDIAIIETGMGGRLDATNVVAPVLSVITSIGFDHCEFLGYTLTAIATEKAGIIKPDCPVVIGRLPPEADTVVRTAAAARGAPLVSVADEFGPDPAAGPATNLAGDYQRGNAATAALAARLFDPLWRLTPELVTRALQQVDWPGRWQTLHAGDRTIILEAAHNAEGAAALDHSLARLAATTGRAPVVVFGALGEARARPLLEVSARHAADLHLVVPRQSRACTHAELRALLPASTAARTHEATVNQLFPAGGGCTAGKAGDTIVVTGSIYLVAEVLARLEPARGQLEDYLQDF